ncbi:hypothetical protein [Lichenifustis flavocetrariae]|uniref:Uncharacterized protein n=1 Tax=Lichenifustis flavocetrariae TaxID=2949735 RepID=A0AA41YY50_9HYPH|nr:hypothetical protein [Lichenifustis flavocetrariae]MCW6506985.1 hypothetical protein [Lichenifustis flavocetrariae]
MLASMAVLHVVDFVMQYRNATTQAGMDAIDAFKKCICPSHPGFNAVNNFALASKHGTIKKLPGFDTDKHRVLSYSPMFPFGLLGAMPSDLLVEFPDGSCVRLLVALDATMALYRAEFPEAFGPSELAEP